MTSMALTEDIFPADDRRLGFVVGGFALLNFRGPFVLQPELLFVQKGMKKVPVQTASGRLTSFEVRVDYIEIPVLAKLEFADRFSVFAGPTFGREVSLKAVDPFGNEIDPYQLGLGISRGRPKHEFGATIGGTVDFVFSVGTMSLDIRYDFGLTDAFGDSRNRGFMVSAGFALYR